MTEEETRSVFLRDLERTAEPDHTVARFPASGGIFFSTGTELFWMTDPQGPFDPEEETMIREKIAFIVLTRPLTNTSFTEVLRDSRIRWAMPQRLIPSFRESTSVPEDRIICIQAGTDVSGIRLSESENSVKIELPDGVAFFPDRKTIGANVGGIVHLVRDPARFEDPFSRWTAAERKDFLDDFGISLKLDHEVWMEYAIREKIPVVEWGYGKIDPVGPEILHEQAERWRSQGGRCLSFHFPNMPPDPSPEAESHIARAVRIALEYRMDRITIHVPDCPVNRMNCHLNDVADRYAAMLAPLLDDGIRIGIENLHMKPNYPADDNRPFGFLPEECVRLVETLRSRTRSDLWGCHLDIGHAYCNPPFSLHYDLAAWLRSCGPLLNGLHIHQFERPVTPEHLWLAGHGHVSGRTVGHPNLIPLFEAWHNGVFRAPMILEVYRGTERTPFFSVDRIRKEPFVSA